MRIGLQLIGNSPDEGRQMGYHQFQQNFRAALLALGVEITDRALTAVHLTHPFWFRPHAAKRNVIFTMYEADRIPKKFADKLNMADIAIVPCEHNKKLFKEFGAFRPEFHIVHLGIDPDRWKYRERKKPTDRPLTFLWIGNVANEKDKRKGWDAVDWAFEKAFIKIDTEGRAYIKDSVRLIKKTTLQVPSKDMPHGGLFSSFGGRVILDTRRYSHEAMQDLYDMSDVFLFPSRGEGAGLPAMEAMACGLLTMAPPLQGLAEFIGDRVAVPLKYHIVKGVGHFDAELIDVPMVEMDDFIRKMIYVYQWYDSDKLIKARRRGARYIRKSFSWRRCATDFLKALYPAVVFCDGCGFAYLNDHDCNASEYKEAII